METVRPIGERVSFGVFEADLRACELRKHGIKIKLQEQPFQILRILLENPGEVVTREELRDQLWASDTFVDFEHGLYNAIKRLREALGDSAESPRFIETIPRRGYRFIAPLTTNGKVRVLPELPADRTSPQPGRQGLGMRIGIVIGLGSAMALLILTGFVYAKFKRRESGTGATPQIRSLAVLPLQNLSGDPAQEYFSDGMTDALVTDLAQVGAVRVISRTSSMQYRDTKKSLPEIARELNVDAIVEGTVQRSGDRVRLTAQLIQGPTDKHIWANSYDREIRDVFALERDLTQEIAQQVLARLTTPSQAPQARVRPVNPNALEAYLQGNYHLQKALMGRGDKELRTAGEYFQQAIDAAPDFALAYVGLAEAHHYPSWPSSEDFALMRRAAEKAVALDPASSEARTELALTKWEDWDWTTAEEEFRRAIALNPNNAFAHDQLANCLYAMGRLEEGWKEFEIAQELEPNQDHLSAPLYWRGDYDLSIHALLKALENRPNDAVSRFFLSEDYAQKGLYEEWVRELSQTVTLMGFAESAGRIQEAFAHSGYLAARRQEAREFEHWIASKQVYMPAILAGVYVSLGDKDRAFYWLRDGIDHHHMDMDDNLQWFKVDPMFAPLRTDPRFKELLLRAGLPP